MKTTIQLFSLVFSLFSLAAWAEEKPAIPSENLIAEIPDLGPIGDFRASWAIVRPPMIWVQDQVFDLQKFSLPTWDTTQVPIVITPPNSGHAWLITEDSSGKVLATIDLKKPFVPESLNTPNSTVEIPARFRFRVEDPKGRLAVETKTYPWISRKQVFQCDFEIDEKTSIESDRRVRSCLNTIKAMSKETGRQWYAKLTWPESRKAEAKGFISTWDRELRSGFRKAKHSYESDRKPKRRFAATVGVTRVEEIQKIEFDLSQLMRAEVVMRSPSREEIKAKLHEQALADGSRIEIFSFAADAVEVRSKSSPQGFTVPVDLQFVATASNEPSFRSTEFREVRTGIPSLFRPWRGNLYFSGNQLTSGRGETALFGNGPGIEVDYKSTIWDLKPYLNFETGLFHPGSTLFINDIRAGVVRGFSGLPAWASVGGGYHQFQLAGQNPGSTRLGKVDALDVGVVGLQRTESHFIRGEVMLIAATSTGFHSKIELGQIHRNKWDIPFTSSVFIGYTRFAADAVNRVQITETFTEDRLNFGVSFGFLGPDSE